MFSIFQLPTWCCWKYFYVGNPFINPLDELKIYIYYCIHILLFLLNSYSVQFSSVTQSCLTLQPHEVEHAKPPCPSPTPGVYPNSCLLSRWCHPIISSSVVLSSSCLQSFSTSGSFQMSQFLASGGQNNGVSASTLVLPTNTQDWFPLGLTGWISLLSKGLSRVLSNTTVQKHPSVSTQFSL